MDLFIQALIAALCAFIVAYVAITAAQTMDRAQAFAPRAVRRRQRETDVYGAEFDRVSRGLLCVKQARERGPKPKPFTVPELRELASEIRARRGWLDV